MNAEIICAIISGAVTLLVSIGTWQISAKKDKDKTREDIQGILNSHYEKSQADIHSIKEDMSQVTATVQTQIGIIETQIDTLTKQVEKHNQVIERTYKLEQAVADIKEDIDSYKGVWK